MTGFVEREGVTVATDAVEVLRQAGLSSFRDFMEFTGGSRVVHKRGRSVYRFEAGGRAFYLKRNRLHPTEFWKAIGRLHLPRLGAQTEWDNIEAVRRSGIPTVTPIAWGEHRSCGLETASFTVTEELYGAEPLDVVVRREFGAAAPRGSHRCKRDLIRSLAGLARRFHAAGMNHQDFYLNHFFLGPDKLLYLLDLQRVQRRQRVPRHYLVKDLAQLNYSTQVYGGFSRSDRLRFLLCYLGLSRLDGASKRLARAIYTKTVRIGRHDVKLMVRRRRRGELP
jgi:heptose I phosphotransferase